MLQIFVFTAGNAEARQHLVDSVENPIDTSVVLDTFTESHHEELERIRTEGRGFYAWGGSDFVRPKPMDLSQTPLVTGASLPLLTVTPPLESR
jgi:hypothetical protein